ncbi:unnamed protein product [Allacma fusca]|uniref:O-acyltransferase WSD1 C-terminal domain-containing protein n=1 Tax=Allacma fusca TaxID=39272 RepID=A0A8J2J3K3_9HEXA|nr:unnamed protein product [Allacma fusca]
MPKASRNNISWSLWDRLKVLFTLPYEMAKMFGIISKGRKIGGRTDGDNLHYSVSSNHSVDLMKSVKNAHNVSFSAVALSCVSGAIARALQNNGREPPKMLDIGYALPLVNHPGGMNVHMLATITELPCGAENSVDRLMKTHEVLRKINFRAILAAKALHDFLRLEAIIPSRLLRIMMMRGSNLGPSASVSNFPATLSKDFVDGLEFVDIFIALSSSTRVGLCISSGGVNGKQRFHFLLDKSIFGTESSAMKIASLYEEELEELLKHEYTDNQDFV